MPRMHSRLNLFAKCNDADDGAVIACQECTVSHGRIWSDNRRKSFTPEVVQSFTETAMVVCLQTITAKVSHQNWCKVSQQKPCSYVVRQSPQKFHTRAGAKFHRKSHGRLP